MNESFIYFSKHVDYQVEWVGHVVISWSYLACGCDVKTLVMMGINKKVMSVQCIPVDSHAYL